MMSAIEKELINDCPRDDVLISLMSETYQHRKSLVSAKKSVRDILTSYPALKRPAVVSEAIYFVNNLCLYLS